VKGNGGARDKVPGEILGLRLFHFRAAPFLNREGFTKRALLFFAEKVIVLQNPPLVAHLLAYTIRVFMLHSTIFQRSLGVQVGIDLL